MKDFQRLKRVVNGLEPSWSIVQYGFSGTKSNFSIYQKATYLYLLLYLFILLFLIPSLLFAQKNYNNLRFWLVEIIVIGSVFAFFKLSPYSRVIHVKTISRRIQLVKLNIFREEIGKPVSIHFSENTGFTFKLKSIAINKSGQKVFYHKIYLSDKKMAYPLIDLPISNQQKGNHETFIKCLENIIKEHH
nr:hypothetical protein [uncultured Allomuricauda sp.]